MEREQPADGDIAAWIWFRLSLTLEDPCESYKYLKASNDHDPVGFGIPKDKVDRLRYWAHVFRIVLDLP